MDSRKKENITFYNPSGQTWRRFNIKMLRQKHPTSCTMIATGVVSTEALRQGESETAWRQNLAEAAAHSSEWAESFVCSEIGRWCHLPAKPETSTESTKWW